MITVVIAAVIIYFIGETAKSRDKVTIVGITINVNDQTAFTAPYPTVKPPRQPTINRTIEIIPKRLNSRDSTIVFGCI